MSRSSNNKANKPPRDPLCPKRPATSYLIFSNIRRKHYLQENPKSKVTELSKIISKEWKKLEPNDKLTYESQAKELKQKYDIALAEYKQTEGFKVFEIKLNDWKKTEKLKNDIENSKLEQYKVKLKKKYKEPKKPTRDSNAPKRAMSSYFLFSNQRRTELSKQYPTKKITDLSKMISEEWKNMNESDKQPYVDGHKREKSKFTDDWAEYIKTETYKEKQKELDEYKRQFKQWEKIIYDSAVQQLNDAMNENNNNDSDSSSDNDSDSESDSDGSHNNKNDNNNNNNNNNNNSNKENSSSINGNGHSNDNNTNSNANGKQTNKKKKKDKKKKSSKKKNSKKSIDYGPKIPVLRKPKKPNDPKCPKKAPSAYFLFAEKFRAKTRELNPGKKITDIAKILGKQWKELNDSEKKPYNVEAERQKNEYNSKLAIYKDSNDFEEFKKVLSQWDLECKTKEEEHSKKVQECYTKWTEKQKKSKEKSHSKSPAKSSKKDSNKSSKKVSKKSSKKDHKKSSKSSKSSKSTNKHSKKSKYDSESSDSRSRSRSRSMSSKSSVSSRGSRSRSRSRGSRGSRGRSRSRSYSKSSTRSGSYSSSRSHSKSSYSSSGSSRSRSGSSSKSSS